jgi:hypothetical protein
MAGLRKICKLYGSIRINGTLYVWDYVKDEPVKESEMTKDERMASERRKWELIKEQQTNGQAK